MRIRTRLLAIPLLLAASTAPAMGDVRDKAGLFSPEAVQKANADLTRIERETHIPVTIESTPALDGVPIGQAIGQHATKDGVRGLFILIAKHEGKIDAAESREYRSMFSRPQLQAIYEAFEPGFRKHDFDAGLSQGVAHLATVLPEIAKSSPAPGAARPPVHAQAPVPAPARRMPAQRSGLGTLIGLVLLVLGVVIVFRLLGALFGARRGGYGPGYGPPGPGAMGGPGYGPGYGGPGYGGRGGGFMSSLFGGLGGAMAGNWLYDQFGRRHGGYEQTGYPPGGEPTAPADAGPDWQDAGDGGGNWGGGDAGGGGGGDWGGGGGGDWGGGGGGGDWGGGGGGDGGSW